MKLFADSGSTKTEWIVTKNNKILHSFSTIGMNPFFITETEIRSELNKESGNFDFTNINSIYFYGAGCSTTIKATWLHSILKTIFKNAIINVKTDIEGAVIATSIKNEKSITTILGTGSAFRIFDGNNIIKKYSSLGYIIGDEGSGTHISKSLLRKVFYQQLTPKLEKYFFEYFKVSREEIIENIYSKPFANRYLAKFTIFCYEHIKEEKIEQIILSSFDIYFQKHILTIKNYKEYKLHFVGSIAYFFKKQLLQIITKYNCKVGSIIQKPIQNIIIKKS